MDGGTNTPTGRVAWTILGVANDIRSDGTNTFAKEIMRLISQSRETRDQSERMGDILGIMRQLLSCMRDITSKQKNIALPVKDGIIVLTAVTEAMDEIRTAVIQKTQGQTAANKINGAALTQMPKERVEGKTATPIIKRRLGDSPVQDSPSKIWKKEEESDATRTGGDYGFSTATAGQEGGEGEPSAMTMCYLHNVNGE